MKPSPAVTALAFVLSALSCRADVNLATGQVLPPKAPEGSVAELAGTDRLIVSGAEQPLVLLKDRPNIIVNETCARDEKQCMAVQALDYLPTTKTPLGIQKWGKRLGATLCEHSKGGVVVIANDPRGNELAVCYFDDQTFVLADSMAQAYYAKRPKLRPVPPRPAARPAAAQPAPQSVAVPTPAAQPPAPVPSR